MILSAILLVVTSFLYIALCRYIHLSSCLVHALSALGMAVVALSMLTGVSLGKN